MVTVRTWLTHDRHDPPVDRVFDAACDLLIASRTFETQATQPADDPPSVCATLGVVDASLRTLGGTMPHLAARAPVGSTDVTTVRTLERAADALAEAAAACDAARQSVLAITKRG